MTQANTLRLALFRHVAKMHANKGIRPEAIDDVVSRILDKHRGTLGVDETGRPVSRVGAHIDDLIDWAIDGASHLLFPRTTTVDQADARAAKKTKVKLSPTERLNLANTGDARGPVSRL